MAAGSDTTTSQLRGSSLLLAGQAFAVLANLAVQVLIVRYLSQESYGAFAYALSIVVVAESISRFGMHRGVTRYMPIYEESGDLRRAAGTLVLAISTVLVVGLATVLVVAGFRGAIAGSFAGDSTAVTVIVVLTLLAPIEALGGILDGVFAVFNQPRAIALRRFVLTPLFRLAIVALLVLGDQSVVFLTIGYVGTGALGILLYAPLLTRLLREHRMLGLLRPGRFLVPAREVLGFTVPMLSSDLTSATLLAAGGIGLGLMAAPSDVATLRAVLPVALTMGYVLTSFGTLMVPLASRHYARSEAPELNGLYWKTAAWTGVLAYPIFLTCVVLAEPLTVILFGERYEAAAPVLAVLAVGQFVNTAAGNNGVILGVFKRVRFIFWTNITAAVAIVVLLLVLIPPFEAVGAAVATSVALVLLNIMRQIGLARGTDVYGIAEEAWAPYAAMALGTAVVLLTELMLAPSDAISVGLVVGAVVVVIGVARESLALAETFPELGRIPVVRALIGSGAR